MSTLSSVRDFARPVSPSATFSRAVSLLAGVVVVGVETVMTRLEIARSRRQLAELDERLGLRVERLPHEHRPLRRR